MHQGFSGEAKRAVEVLYIYIYMWEDRSQKDHNDKPNLRFFHGNFWPVISQDVRKPRFSISIPRGPNPPPCHSHSHSQRRRRGCGCGCGCGLSGTVLYLRTWCPVRTPMASQLRSQSGKHTWPEWPETAGSKRFQANATGNNSRNGFQANLGWFGTDFKTFF